MNQKISVAAISVSVSALAIIASSTGFKDDGENISENDVSKLIVSLDKMDSNPFHNQKVIESLTDEDGNIGGVNVKEIFAQYASTNDDSTKLGSSLNVFIATPVLGDITNCHSNCHVNCHGSRSWR